MIGGTWLQAPGGPADISKSLVLFIKMNRFDLIPDDQAKENFNHLMGLAWQISIQVLAQSNFAELLS